MELKLHEEPIEETTQEQPVSEYAENVYMDREDTHREWQNMDDSPYVASNTRRLSQTEFYQHMVMRKARTDITVSAIMVYITCAFSVLLRVLLGRGLFSLDILLVLGLGLGIQLCKSRGCAVALSVYVVINMLYMWFVVGGRYSGWLMIWAAYDAVRGTFAFQEAWKEYETTGSYPGLE